MTGSRSPRIQVMGFAHFAEAGGGRFGREVAVRRGEELVADHKFANSGRAQQRREVMRVQVPAFMGLTVGRPLMKTHRIRKSGLEQIVVPNGGAPKDVAEKAALFFL